MQRSVTDVDLGGIYHRVGSLEDKDRFAWVKIFIMEISGLWKQWPWKESTFAQKKKVSHNIVSVGFSADHMGILNQGRL